ncbi:aldo/keto reductase [Mangrovimicrobium sediminis]|uniref:Aldo/keto reductase n=1 Tax=Mangrovimicrobium sediminis TaxID=2562682 RepID=A0A4Z0MA25_9GAMM|nr:aldo/keto reductase [Haliea sp. SAOS-164]TGD76250.1 aldo/keto reductase [Haliea sp. SAOS-164]
MSIGKRKLGGREVCPVGFGCMSLSFAYGRQPSDEEGAAILHRALDLGYDHLDTARLYGMGHNEELIGNALKGMRQRFYLASKTGIFYEDGVRRVDCRPEKLREACEISLKLLQTDHIDLYYLHRHDYDVPVEESVGALADLMREGKIGGIGLSEVSAATLRRAAAEHPVAAVQNEYSLWTRNPELGVSEACAELGTTLVAFSPLGRGVLADGLRDPAQMEENDFRAGMPRFSAQNWPRNLALVDAFNAIAEGQGVTPAQLALAWVLSRGDHVVTIPGTGRMAHMEENIARWDWQPPAAVLAELDALINQETVVGHRYGEAMRANVDTEEFA